MVAELQNTLEVEGDIEARDIQAYRLDIRSFAERAEYQRNEANHAERRALNCRKGGSFAAEDGFLTHARNCRKSANNELRAWGAKILDFALAYPNHPSVAGYLTELRNHLNTSL
jgi:hypothetical protein